MCTNLHSFPHKFHTSLLVPTNYHETWSHMIRVQITISHSCRHMNVDIFFWFLVATNCILRYCRPYLNNNFVKLQWSLAELINYKLCLLWNFTFRKLWLNPICIIRLNSRVSTFMSVVGLHSLTCIYGYIYNCQGTLHIYIDEWMVSIFNISMGIKKTYWSCVWYHVTRWASLYYYNTKDMISVDTMLTPYSFLIAFVNAF